MLLLINLVFPLYFRLFLFRKLLICGILFICEKKYYFIRCVYRSADKKNNTPDSMLFFADALQVDRIPGLSSLGNNAAEGRSRIFSKRANLQYKIPKNEIKNYT